jgi:hypothetical protein
MNCIQNVCLVCVLAASTGGCVVYQSGERIEPTLMNQIHRNVTTRAQVEDLFGPPMRVQIIDIGQRMLSYWYREVYDPGPFTNRIETRHQRLLVWTGPDNIVKDFEFTDYLTERSIEGVTQVVKRAAVPTQPSAAPRVWFPGGED